MDLIRWNPIRELEEISNRLDSVFGRRQGEGATSRLAVSDWSPTVDIEETEGEFLVTAELPGVEKKDIHIKLENGSLIVQGERRVEKEETQKKLHRIERSYGSFFRSFALPEEIDREKISADYEDGLLKVHLPKAPETEVSAKEITIE